MGTEGIKVEIRAVELTDLGGMLLLQKECYQENARRYDNLAIAPLMETMDQIREVFETTVMLKAVTESKMIGGVRVEEKDGSCHIGRLIVHPDYQNRGIGRMLMNEVEKRFSHVVRFELFTGFKDEKNLYLYGKLGYREFREEDMGEGMRFVFLEKVMGGVRVDCAGEAA